MSETKFLIYIYTIVLVMNVDFRKSAASEDICIFESYLKAF